MLGRLGKAIRNHRLQLNLTQEEISNATGMARSYITGIERGQRNISVVALTRIAKTLNISAWKLFKEVEKDNGKARR